MNKLSIITSAAAAVLLSGVVQASTETSQKTYSLPQCDKPAISIVVGKVACKASSCDSGQAGRGAAANPLLMVMGAMGVPSVSGIGDGMGDMLTTTLRTTGCFDIQEREAMDEINKELALVGKKVEAKQADYLISGAVTSINLSQERTSLGFGLIPVIGAISNTTQKANVTMDIRLVDVNHAKILDSRTFEANSQESSLGLGGGGFAGVGAFGGSFSKLNGTALGAVARDAILRATIFITESLAHDYITGHTDLVQEKGKASQESGPKALDGLPG